MLFIISLHPPFGITCADAMLIQQKNHCYRAAFLANAVGLVPPPDWPNVACGALGGKHVDLLSNGKHGHP